MNTTTEATPRATSTRVDVRPILAILFPEGNGASRIGRAFYLMGIAEEEIEAAMKKAPRKRAAIKGAFRYLYTPVLMTYGDELYRAHCREIIGRVKRGEDLSPGTDAEMLATFSEMSTKAPLASEFANAMSEVFFRVFPEKSREVYAAGHEAWEGRKEEILSELRRKLSRNRDSRL